MSSSSQNDTAQEKPLPATPKRRQEYRDEGKFAKARDATAVGTICGVMLAFALGHGAMMSAVDDLVRRCFGDLTAITRGDGATLLAIAPMTLFVLIGPVAIAAAFGGILLGGAQSGFRFYPKMVAVKFDRLNPLPKLKQLFDIKHALFEILLAVFRVGIVGAVCYQSLTEDMPMLLGLAGSPVAVSFGITVNALLGMTMKATGVLVIMAIIDYAHNRYKLEKEMRMSRHDLKEEMKQHEQDPLLKGKRTGRMREVSRQRIIAAVSEADAIVTNPTHLSVALRYGETDFAPTVVAKGHDQLALRIRAEARKFGIPIIENRPLARALYGEIEMGQPIGVDHYGAVAEVLAFVFRLRGGRRAPGRAPRGRRQARQ